jgi:predicted transcriptional regulator
MSARKFVLKQQYRTSMGILSEILQIIMDGGIGGVIVSEISRKANLSHNATVENCQKLINACLINSDRKGRNYIFVVTTKGIEFFQEFRRFQEVVQEMNLRY